MATALYRRYRPEAFSEMIGQGHVTEPLMTALRTGRIGHAYLFSGPRGCGKTTSARILARCLNCAEGPTDTPCGVCPSCVELSRSGGGSLDVIEIDAASHGGVDDARDLRERAVFAPARDRYKIFIIDEAHMVTSGGFNALLKIVEEPPPHVKFVFATTEPEKVIGTIRSRTHHYPFRLIAPGALIDYVQQLCDSEGVAVEPGVLPLVVRSGGGSVRDTLSILDQLIAGSENGGVTLERATGLLGFTSAELIDEVVDALAAGDSAGAFGATHRVVQTGQDPRRFVEDLLERLRDLIVITATTVQGASAVFRGVPEDQLQRMFEQAQRFARGQLSKIADTVSGTLDTMVGATAPSLQLELMIARALLVQTGVAVAAGGGQGGSPAAAPSAPSAGPAQTAPAPAASVPAPSAAPTRSPAAAPSPAPAASSVETPSPAPPPARPAATPPAADPAAVDVIAAMRSARDFLKSDNSGADRPPMVPLGGHPKTEAAPESTASEASSNAETSNTETANAEPSSTNQENADQVPSTEQIAAPEVDTVSLEDLVEVWPDLLEELLESDREAWNAVRAVQPVALEGDLLTVGVTTVSDLNAFKASGAGPLREAITGALGITVKYVPKQLPAGTPPVAAERESGDQPPKEPSPAAEPVPEPEPELGPEPEPQPEPGPEPDPEPEPDATPEPDVEPVAASVPTPAPAAPPQPTRPKQTESPGFTRYGEAVVREVLGARFIEERPLPANLEK